MKINTSVEDTEVKGVIILRSAGDITVQITKPFSNISMGVHIPYIARAHKSFNGEYGDTTAELLLKDLYDIGRYLDVEMSGIREKLDNAKDRISQLPAQINNDKFLEKRRELKKTFQQGEIDSKDYQKSLGLLRKKAEDFNQNVTEIMDTFFDDSFPMCVPCGTREEVLDIIDGKKALIVGSIY